jgi:fructokinase
MNERWVGCVEAGGTKFMCAVGNSKRELLAITRIDTTSPDETLGRVKAYFIEQSAHYPIQQFGICSFGPLDLRPSSPNYRQIIDTPKPGWNNINIAGYLEDEFKIPATIDTDVNGAALSEYLWGAGQGLESLVYLTIGTGIGGEPL